METLLRTNYNQIPNKQSNLNYSLIRQKYNLVDKQLLSKIKKLCKIANVDEKGLSLIIKNIKSLNPKPAELYSDNNFLDPKLHQELSLKSHQTCYSLFAKNLGLTQLII